MQPFMESDFPFVITVELEAREVVFFFYFPFIPLAHTVFQPVLFEEWKVYLFSLLGG
jgi:hypothetical protein